MIGLQKKPAFLTYERFGYLSRKNTLDAQFKVQGYDQLFKKGSKMNNVSVPAANFFIKTTFLFLQYMNTINDWEVFQSTSFGAKLRYDKMVK